jgi:hypothetical protein
MARSNCHTLRHANIQVTLYDNSHAPVLQISITQKLQLVPFS